MRGFLLLVALGGCGWASAEPFAPLGHGKPFMAYSYGGSSCGQFLGSTKQSPDLSYISEHGYFIQWAHGYITAFNALNAKARSVTNLEESGVSIWLQNWCAQNPIKPYVQAVEALIKDQLKP